MTCDAKIRPLPNDTEISCEADGPHKAHGGTLHDYAYPGSATLITWLEDDRRTYHGAWPGPCTVTPGCVLPNGHPRRCAT